MVVPFLKMVFSMFMRLFMMVYIFWILLHILTVWMSRDESIVMIIPHTYGIAVLVILA
jgi:hypothetical protein